MTARLRGHLVAACVAGIVGGCATGTDPAAQARAPVAAEPAPQAPAAPGAALAGTRLPVRNADFEAEPLPRRNCPPTWWCTMHADPNAYRFRVESDSSGRGRYLEVTRLTPEPWALVTQGVPAAGLAGRRIRLSVLVNAEKLEGSAGPMLIFQGAGGRVIGHEMSLIPRGSGWRRTSTEIDVPAGAELVEIGLKVEGGGTVGFDDVVATVEDRPAAGGK